jgi:uncharacterized membrane protein
MQTVPNLIILDTAAAVVIIVLASLSRRLGEALKIRPYYRLMYVGVALLLFATLINAVFHDPTVVTGRSVADVLPGALRFCAAIIAVASCLRYWKWLFSEYLKK